MCWGHFQIQLSVFRRPEIFSGELYHWDRRGIDCALDCHCLSFGIHNPTGILKNMIRVTLILFCSCRIVSGLGDLGCFHWDDCVFVSRSYTHIHDSFLVITMIRNSDLGLIISSRSCANSKLSLFCSVDSNLSTNLEILMINKYLRSLKLCFTC